MKVHKKIYVGVRVQSKNAEGVPKGFLTPYEDNAAGKKRMATVDTWTGTGHDDDPTPWYLRDATRQKAKATLIDGQKHVVFDNDPMFGFKISGWNSRSTSDNKVVNITDPRGFELEIYIPNLFELLKSTTVEKGLFKEKLVWARDTSSNYLVTADSEVYQKSLTDEPVEMKPLKPGYIVETSRGIQYQYLGKVFYEFQSTKFTETPAANRHAYPQTTYTPILSEPIKFSPGIAKHAYQLVNAKYANGRVAFRSSFMKIDRIISDEELDTDFTKVYDIDFDNAGRHTSAGAWHPGGDTVIAHPHFVYKAKLSNTKFGA